MTHDIYFNGIEDPKNPGKRIPGLNQELEEFTKNLNPNNPHREAVRDKLQEIGARLTKNEFPFKDAFLPDP